MFVDTHTHLDASKFEEDIDLVIHNALEKGVEIMMMPNVDPSTHQGMMSVHMKWPDNCLPMIGIHPCSVKKDFKSQIEWVKREVALGKYYAVGEIGIDLYWDTSLRKEQEECFRSQVELAANHQLPVNIHSRESIDLCIEHIEDLKKSNPELTGIFHCFTGTAEQAKRIVDIGGFLMGIGGVLTFKNSNLKEAIREISLDYIVLETDAPYLTPHPYRGKRNEPAYIPFIAQSLAELYELPLAVIEERTTENALRIYKLTH